jgi:hypothetical protein
MAAEAAVQSSVQSCDAQLGLYERGIGRPSGVSRVPRPRVLPPRPVATLCAGCRAREARYGFRDADGGERPRTLCFECFRMELDFRQRVAAQLARGWNGEQARLPLAETLEELAIRRRRAQIAARHAIA